MQSGVTSGNVDGKAKRIDIGETEVERRGLKYELGAPVTGAATVGDAVAVGFGDGSLRFFRPGQKPLVLQAHLGVILCMAAFQDVLVTGGDDGRFLRVTPNGVMQELADFDTKWVDCVAATEGLVACSSGKNVQLWSDGHSKPLNFVHSSTVGGLSFDAKGQRLAVAHYGGVTLWERTKRKWKASTFAWKGFHGAVTFSPDGKYLVSAMQENAVHGWRIRDKLTLPCQAIPPRSKVLPGPGTPLFL
jgi:WD40 repeat protein